MSLYDESRVVIINRQKNLILTAIDNTIPVTVHYRLEVILKGYQCMMMYSTYYCINDSMIPSIHSVLVCCQCMNTISGSRDQFYYHTKSTDALAMPTTMYITCYLKAATLFLSILERRLKSQQPALLLLCINLQFT